MSRAFRTGTFAATGRLPGRERFVTVQWTDGELSGDREACELIRAAAWSRDAQAVGPMEGPYTYRDYLASGLSTVMLIRDLFNDAATWSGDVPHRTAPPIND